jgi:hypothetical protein
MTNFDDCTTNSTLDSLDDLDLSTNSLQSVPQLFLSRATGLRNLNLRGNLLKTIDIPTMLHLRVLHLANNTIHELRPNDFVGVPSLRYLSLSGNYLHNITQDPFKALSHITELHISNMITLVTIATDSFNQMPSLVSLKISENYRLTQFDSSIFSNLTNLKELFLQGNGISIFNRVSFDVIPRLASLEIHSNPFKCDCKVKWIYDLISQRNSDVRIKNVITSRYTDVIGKRDDVTSAQDRSDSWNNGGMVGPLGWRPTWASTWWTNKDKFRCASPLHIINQRLSEVGKEELTCEQPIVTSLGSVVRSVVEGDNLTLTV